MLLPTDSNAPFASEAKIRRNHAKQRGRVQKKYACRYKNTTNFILEYAHRFIMSLAHVLCLFLSLFASCPTTRVWADVEGVYKNLAATLREKGVSAYGPPDLSHKWEVLTRFAEWRRYYLYYRSVVVSNAACSGNVGSAGGCPALVVRPTCTEQVSAIIQLCAKQNVSVSIRGGGHSYTCQGSKRGGVMIDTRLLNSIRLVAEGEEGGDRVELGAGLTWGEVLRYLRPRQYSIVHGQCTSVGVAGFALHGGVHFGGLSEVFGLASDNIVGLTLVDARGRIVSLTPTSCSIDGKPVIDGNINSNSSTFEFAGGSTDSATTFQDCRDLWFAMRGSGSSFGVATLITMRIHRFPPSSPPFPPSLAPLSSPHLPLSSSSHQENNKKLVSALSILTINTLNTTLAQQAISHFMLSVDQRVSLTFFGLDAYFKAYSFIVKFAKHSLREGISYDIKSLFSSPFKGQRQREGGGENVEKSIHFIVEASWFSGEEEEEENEEKKQKSSTSLGRLNEALLNLSSQVYLHSVKVVETRPFVLTADTWSVPSYDLVWGSGHLYAGATIGVTTSAQEQQVIRVSFDRHNDHIIKSTNKCSDCVTVFHRVGPGLRSFANSTSSSFHPLRANLSLWLEVDCGHFFRKASSWRHCNSFVDETQVLLDMAATTVVVSEDGTTADPKEKDGDHSSTFHYPNVPNLSHSKNSVPAKYFGKNVARLVRAKQYWDPDNVFYHSQSVPLHSFSGKTGENANVVHSETDTEQKTTAFSTSLQSTCNCLYLFAALRDARRFLSFISFFWGLKALWSLAYKALFFK